MHTVRTLLFWKYKLWKAVLFDRSRDSVIRNGTTALVLAVLLYTAYRFFHDLIFSYVTGLEEIGFLLIERLLSTGFLAFFLMLIVSSFVAVIAVMFRSDETEYLFSTPISALELFSSRFFDTAVFSSWAILVMALPMLLAYARVRGFGLAEYIIAGIFLLLPFVLSAVSLGAMLALGAVVLSRRVSMRKLVPAGMGLFAALVLAFAYLSRPTDLQIPFNEDFRSLNLFINNFHLNSHPFTPNFWLVQGLESLVRGRFADFGLYAAALLSSAFLALALLHLLAKNMFFPAWLASLEEISRLPTVRDRTRWNLLALVPAGSRIRALLTKDLILFLRDPSQWAQLIIILLLLVIYFINLRFVPTDIEIEHWRSIVVLMNFVFTGFVLATLAVRFIFPSISLEGSSFWVIGTAPIPAGELFREKFWSAFTVFFLIAEPMAVLAGLMLQLDGFYLVVTVSGILVMSITLSCLAVGFGAAFPSFAESDPSRIASSPGGILTITVSLGYVGCMAALVAVPLYRYTGYLVSGGMFPSVSIAVCSVLMLLLNVLMVFFAIRLGTRSLARREY